MSLIPDTKKWLKLLVVGIVLASLIWLNISIWVEVALRGVI